MWYMRYILRENIARQRKVAQRRKAMRHKRKLNESCEKIYDFFPWNLSARAKFICVCVCVFRASALGVI